MLRPFALLRVSREAPAIAAALLSLAVPAAAGAEADPATVETAIDAWRADREADILRDFVELLSLPNVATNPADMQRKPGTSPGCWSSGGSRHAH